MGSYLGKQEPPARGLGRGSREIKEKLTRPNPDVVTPARRLSFRETPVVANRAYMSPRRRYPIHQPQYNMAGSLPMVCLDGYQRKTLLSPRNHGFRSPVTVKIARPDADVAHSPVLNLLSPCPAPPSTQCPPDPCAKETVLNAIREGRKRLNKEDDNSMFGGLESKRRRHGSRGSDTEFAPLVTNGLPSLISKPDSMKRGQNMQAVDETASKRSRTSSSSSLSNATAGGIPMSAHNAITSSYSSSKDLLQKRKRAVLNTSTVSSTASSRCQTPEWPVKKPKGDMHEDTSQSTPVKSDSGNRSSGQVSETPISKWSSAINTSSESPGSSGSRRCKLLPVSSGRGDQYQLLPPPLVRYNINSKEFDCERKTAIQKLNKVVEDETDVPPSSMVPVSTGSSVPFTQPTAQATLGSQSITANNSLLQSLAKMQSQSPPAPEATVTLVQATNKAITAVPNMTLSFGVNQSSAESPFSVSNASQSISAPATSASTSTTFPQLLGSTQPKPQSPKSGLLLQMLTKPEEKSSQPAFKPIFGAAPTVSSVPAATLSSEATPTFKPVFGETLNQPASATTFKPIFGESSSKPPASSTFTLQTVSSNATPSFSNISSTGATIGNASKSTADLPVSTNNTLNSNTVPSFQFGGASQSLPTTTSSTTSVFGGNTANAPQTTAATFGQTPNSQAGTGFTMFGNASSTSTQPQSSNAFGSASSAFSAAFGSKPNSFPSNNGTAAFNISAGGELQANKSTANPTFGGSSVQSAFGSGSSQSAFSSGTQSAFGASVQPAFGTTNTTLSFGNATPASTKAATFSSMNSTQTSSSTPNTNMFGGSNPAPFAFGNTANSTISFGGGSQSSTAGNNGFNFGAASTAPPTASVFGASTTNQNNIASPNTTFAFGTPGATEQKLPFGTSTPAFGQAASTPPLPFGSPAPGFQNANPSFSPATPSFSIGSGSKPSAVRQRLMARRQHTRKK